MKRRITINDDLLNSKESSQVRQFIYHINSQIDLPAGELSISFVAEDSIADLNQTYRQKEGPTDVLTFTINDDDILGDIIICPAIVAKHAAEDQQPVWNELSRVIAHGFAHLAGYDHPNEQDRAKMKDFEDQFIISFKESNE